MERNSVASLADSLSESFKHVPPPAIPPMLDAILVSTGTSPSALFTSLLDSFPNFTEDKIREDKESKLTRAITSLVCALCHLLKKCGVSDDVLQAYISKAYIPLMKMVHLFDGEMINQVAESFFGVVNETNAWRVLENALVPFLLRSIGVSISMLQSSKVDIIEQQKCLITDSVTINSAVSENGKLLMSSGFLALPTSCHCLAQILDAVLKCEQATSTSVSILSTGHGAEKFAVNLLSDICSLSESLLSQDPQQRSCAISFLFPVIFKAFTSFEGLDIVVQGQTCIVFRKLYVEKIWKRCKKLLSQGHVERRDAFHLLSLLFSFYACEEERDHRSRSGKEEEFDIRDDKVFWDEIKRGLVDKESLVRKQSLHILKMSLRVNKEKQNNSGLMDPNLQERHLKAHRMTKRELWANKEARSLGAGEVCRAIEFHESSQRHWEAFLLLYEMLEEYGTHLVEAAWNHQILVLLHFCVHDSGGSSDELINHNHITFGNFSEWLSILWECGFIHDNPIVRCLILESFLGIEWKNFGSCAKPLPELFILGSLMQGLNDPVHHKDFGVKGVYSSKIIDGAVQFLYEYTSYISLRQRMAFLINLASLAKQQSFGRAGLMALSECIASVARRIGNDCGIELEKHENPILHGLPLTHAARCFPSSEQTDLLDALRYVADSCKQHFNPRYRLQVCGKILEAASLLVCSSAVSFEMLLHFISVFPKEFTGYGGSLRMKVKGWLLSCQRKGSIGSCTAELNLLKSLDDFPYTFIRYHHPEAASFTFDDGDIVAWECEAKRWAMALFLIQTEEYQFKSILKFIKDHSMNVSEQSNTFERLPVKFLILLSSLILELQEIQEKCYRHVYNIDKLSKGGCCDTLNELSHINASVYENFLQTFLFVLNDLVSYANLLSSIFWSPVEDSHLPNSVRGKLGGPSQRRLSSVISTLVLQAIISVKAVACISLWCSGMTSYDTPKFAFEFLWNFLWRTISSSNIASETGAELHLAAYEALASVLRTLASGFSSSIVKVMWEKDDYGTSKLGGKPLLDSLVLTFLEHINKLLGVGLLARTRRAILLNAKWSCLESLLAIPYQIIDDGVKLKGCKLLFLDTAVKWIYNDIVDSLENAGEDSVLSMLRSVRLILGLFASGRLGSLVSPPISQDNEMMWQLVRSSFLLHVSCNKRRVAAIAALLSSVLHPSVFDDESMHMKDNACGPLKWFIEKILEEGTKSPRTIRLAALHLTGLWLSNPGILKYYIKELKLLSLHGSVAFDEDFEAELAENQDAKVEVSLLSKSLDPELTEAFINTELYARVSVAVLFQKLADLAEANKITSENSVSVAALEAGKLFLVELLDSAVAEKDLSKELYKKYSAIHRRKVRAWQMICVLTKFVSEDIVDKVSHSLRVALHRNNLPAVRQYLETFAINVFLKFPSLVQEQLVPILHDYDIKPQALSSYVFIAANIILHASNGVQYRHLDNLLPAIIPLLTSHHHSLRGFTQLLVYKVLNKLYPPGDLRASEGMPLERRSFDNLREYLAKNSDCRRLRVSMEGYLDAYNPEVSATPKGIFVNRVEELEFECVPTSLMEQVLSFLNDVREDLRHSMAKDSVAIKNEGLRIDEDKKEALSHPSSGGGDLMNLPPENSSMNFQRKFALSKTEKQESQANCFLDLNQTYNTLLETDKEDQLLDQLLQSRIATINRIRGCRQEIILVASLLDRIPNLAGLARTCEVFKASGLVIADANILCDKQFQLISVTAEKWVPIIEVPVESLKGYLEKKRQGGFSILGLEQTANSVPLDQYAFPKKTVLVLGREKEGIPVDIIHILDACVEIPQLGVVRSLNVHVSGAIAIWEYTRQQRTK